MKVGSLLGKSVTVAGRAALVLLCIEIQAAQAEAPGRKSGLLSSASAGPSREQGLGLPKQYTTKSWQTEDGLPQMTPRAILQTRDGYLWVGTFNGLARFDGIRFQSFTVNTTPALQSDTINVLHESRDGSLWIGTAESGLVRYRSGTFTAFDGSRARARQSVNAICEDGQGRIWVGASDGLYTIAGEQLVPQDPNFEAGVEIMELLRRGETEMWAGTRDSLRSIKEGGVMERLITFQEPVHEVGLDGLDRPWVGFSAGALGFVESESGTFHAAPRRLKANAMHRGKGGALWIGTSLGRLYRLEAGETNRFIRTASLAESPISTIYEDRDGNLWVGIEAHGLWRLQEKLVENLGTERGLLIPMVTSMCQNSEGHIWVGTFGKGLHRWDAQSFSHVRTRREDVNITSLLEDRDGSVWYSTYGSGLGRRDAAGNLDFPSGFGARSRVLFEDREGSLWIGTLDKGVEHVKEGI